MGLPSCRYFMEKGGGRNNKGVCNKYIDDTNHTPPAPSQEENQLLSVIIKIYTKVQL